MNGKGRRMKPRVSKKNFSRNARPHPKNLKSAPMRGGIRL